MSFVIDVSVTLAWYFEDAQTPAVSAVLDRVTNDGALVPSLWKLEVANGLQMAVRRKRIDAVFRDRALQQLGLLPIAVDADTESFAWTATVRMADHHGLTVYDAAYLELAQRRGLSLASLDGDLCRAATSLGVRLAVPPEH